MYADLVQLYSLVFNPLVVTIGGLTFVLTVIVATLDVRRRSGL